MKAFSARFKKQSTKWILVAAVAGLLPASAGAQNALQGTLAFFYAPAVDAHQPLIQKINATQSSLNMYMFHMTDPEVVSALTAAASRGVSVRMIFDKIQYSNPKGTAVVSQLTGGGVQVRRATPAFSITHAKAATFDAALAMVSTMNQVATFTDMLDYGIFTQDPGVISEMTTVFEADWQNSADGTGNTPSLQDGNLVWSPINSEARLVALIDSAHSTLILTVENLGEQAIMDALTRAAGRGVQVRTIVPMCDIGTPSFNQKPSQDLRAAGVDARMMPGPATSDLPYVHAKSIVVDQQVVYLGSENFSVNSLEKARELGIILPNRALASSLDIFFEKYWASAQPPPAQQGYNCPAFPATNTLAPADVMPRLLQVQAAQHGQAKLLNH